MATLPQDLSQLAQPWAKPNPAVTPVTSQQADPIAQRQAAQTTPPSKASDDLSNEDLAALTESWRHLAEAGDPRADKLRVYIGQQGNSILHPEQQADPTGVIKKGWDWLNKGLISRDTMVGAISGMTPDQLDKAMSSYAGETPTHAAIREFTRGAIQDIGTLGSSFTSPLSVATIGGGAALSQVPEAISMAPGTIGAIMRGARAAQGVAAGGFALQGASQALQPGLANTPEAWNARLAGAGQAALGSSGALESAPGVFDTGKEIATSLSHPIQSARSIVQAAVEPFVLRGQPEDLMTRAVKPTSSNTGWDDAIKTAMPDLKAAEADVGSPVQGVDDALAAVNLAKKKVWGEYQAQLAAANAQGPTQGHLVTGFDPSIDGNKIADAMMQSIDKRQATLDPGLTDRVKARADTYRRPMTLDEAEDFLQSANNDLNSYYAKNKVGRRVAQGDPETAQTVAEADALRDNLYSKITELTGEDPTDPKSRYGALSNVENELLRRKNVAARQQPMSLQEQVAAPMAAGKIVSGLVKGTWGGDPSEGFSRVREGATQLVASQALKNAMTTDNMISTAFERYGRPQGIVQNLLSGTKGEAGLPGTVDEDDKPIGINRAVNRWVGKGEYRGQGETAIENLNRTQGQDVRTKGLRRPVYAYHVTDDPGNLVSIAKNGLKPGTTDHPYLDPKDTIYHGVYLSSEEHLDDGEIRVTLKKGDKLDHDPELLAPITIGDKYTIKPERVDPNQRTSGSDMIYRKGTIPPSQLEVKTPKGKWINIKNLLKGEKGELGLPGTVNEDDIDARLRQVNNAVRQGDDTALYQQARTELGANASFSDVAKRAQELKLSGVNARRTTQDTARDINAMAAKDKPLAAEDAAQKGRAKEIAEKYPVQPGALADTIAAPPKPVEQPNAPTFYSKAERAAAGLPGSASGQQMLNTLINKGVKPSELEWTGADKWLADQKKVTRQQVQDYLKQNGIQLGEETLTNYPGPNPNPETPVNSTKYHGYTEPGPKSNYAEKLITLPGETKPMWRLRYKDGSGILEHTFDSPEEAQHAINEAGVKDTVEVSPDVERRPILPETNDPYEARRRRIEEGALQFQSGHWDEPNVLAHARYDDRMTADGKKALFVEEAQSDWHQQGKKVGYGVDNPNGPGEIPDAPFKNDWHELVMKRMLREAAERGSDKLAWTTGDQQAERYDLSKHVAGVSLDSQNNLYTLDHDGNLSKIADGVKPEKIADYVGKDAAQKLLSAKPNQQGARSLNGLDLKTGGEWAKALYDRAIPNFLNKFGKRFGVKVGESTITGSHDASMNERFQSVNKAQQILSSGGEVYGVDEHGHEHLLVDPASAKAYEQFVMGDKQPDKKVHSIDITPAMRRMLLKEGQPIASDKTFDAQGAQPA